MSRFVELLMSYRKFWQSSDQFDFELYGTLVLIATIKPRALKLQFLLLNLIEKDLCYELHFILLFFNKGNNK